MCTKMIYYVVKIETEMTLFVIPVITVYINILFVFQMC